MSFNIDSLKKLKHVHLIFKYEKSYMYSYNTLVYFYDEVFDTFIESAFVACKRYTSLQKVEELYDYTECINEAIDTNMSVIDVFNYLRLCPENFANTIDMSTCSLEQLQNIIDANINALMRLNSYIQERKMLEDIERV